MMASKQISRREILTNVNKAMRLLTSALEALAVEDDEHPPCRQMARQRFEEAVVQSPCVATAPRARYVVFDFETNGIGKTANIRICQIGATALADDFTVVDRFSHFCNPLVKIDKCATKIHGFDEDFVTNFDSWKVVGENFMQWIHIMRSADHEHPVTMMAHNGKRFDARILVSENARHGIEMPHNIYHSDTIPVMKALFPGRSSYALGKIYEDVIGSPLPDAHDAMADVNGVIEVLKRGHPAELTQAIETYQESFNHIIKRALKVT